MASDESVRSVFIGCNDQNISQQYMSAIQKMESVNQDLLQVGKNLKRIAEQSGPLESLLNELLRTLPKPNLQLNMETD